MWDVNNVFIDKYHKLHNVNKIAWIKSIKLSVKPVHKRWGWAYLSSLLNTTIFYYQRIRIMVNNRRLFVVDCLHQRFDEPLRMILAQLWWPWWCNKGLIYAMVIKLRDKNGGFHLIPSHGPLHLPPASVMSQSNLYWLRAWRAFAWRVKHWFGAFDPSVVALWIDRTKSARFSWLTPKPTPIPVSIPNVPRF